jgi:pyruvate formate lyase activating enzyme
MMSEQQGLVVNIQRFSIHDGPGIRTTVFMKGCSLRCYWCHNPESIGLAPEIQFTPSRCIGCGACVETCPHAADGRTARFTPQCDGCGKCAEACYAGALNLAGTYYTADDLAKVLLADRDLMIRYGGGVTFSGGEPLLQTDFVASVLSILKEQGIHTAIETASNVPWESMEKVIPLTDLFLCDVKAASAEQHRRGTGADNSLIRENLRRLSAAGAAILPRVPVIPEFNDDDDTIREIGRFVQSLEGSGEIELLPFHNMCAGKYDALGREFAAKNLESPAEDRMARLTSVLESLSLKVVRRY